MADIDHPSNSTAQKEAESTIVDAAATVLGLELVRDRRFTSIIVGTRAHVEVDAATPDQSPAIEEFAGREY